MKIKLDMQQCAIVMFLAILLVVGGIFAYSKFRGNGMETYASQTYGLTFSYPSSYILKETTIEGDQGSIGTALVLHDKAFKQPENGEGPPGITISIYDTVPAPKAGQSASQIWIATSPYSNFNLSSMEKPGLSNVDNQEAYLYTWDGLYPSTTLVTEHKGRLLVFTVMYDGASDMETREEFTNLMETLDLTE